MAKILSDRLYYNASQSSGRQYLRETFPKFIPQSPKTRSRDCRSTQPVERFRDYVRCSELDST
jgi:hypothetical protein